MDKIDLDQVLIDDLASQYPSEMEKLNIHSWIVPKAYGGVLGSIAGLLERGRWLASQNVTSAIALGQCFLGTLPVWIGGSEGQKKLAAERLLNRENSCLALTEKEHGSDLSSSSVFYKDEKLNGTKWCINNATKGTTMSVLANSDKGLTLIFLDKIQSGNFENTNKIKTLGIKGADISGITFKDTPAPLHMVVGRQGKGLDLVAKTLQVSRTLCAAFSLGAFEACLNMTEDFVQRRELYGRKLITINSVEELINQAKWRFEICESVSLVMCRAVTMNPEMMSLYSAVVKYLVPKLTSEGIDILSEVLGARGYINEEEYPLFEKMKRDHSVVPLFDGSSAVNLSIISGQIGNIRRHLDSESKSWDVFKLDIEASKFDGKGLKLSNRGNDFIWSQYNEKNAFINQKRDEFKMSLNHDWDAFSFRARQRSDDYCRLVAAVCHHQLGKDVPLELFNKLY